MIITIGPFHVLQTLLRIFKGVFLGFNVKGSPLHVATEFRYLSKLNVRDKPAMSDPTQKAKSTAKMDTHAANDFVELYAGMGILVIARLCGVNLQDVEGRGLPQERYEAIVEMALRIFEGVELMFSNFVAKVLATLTATQCTPWTFCLWCTDMRITHAWFAC